MGVYLSCFLILLSSVLVVSSFSPVFAMIWLVISFIIGAFLFWQLEASFLALLLVMVYVGAIAVMFLFVIMMLPTVLKPVSLDLSKFIPVTIFVPFLVIWGGVSFPINDSMFDVELTSWSSLNQTSIDNLFLLLYSWDFPVLAICGLILLIALVGALMLCTGQIGEVSKTSHQDLFIQRSR